MPPARTASLPFKRTGKFNVSPRLTALTCISSASIGFRRSTTAVAADNTLARSGLSRAREAQSSARLRNARTLLTAPCTADLDRLQAIDHRGGSGQHAGEVRLVARPRGPVLGTFAQRAHLVDGAVHRR